MNKLLWTLLPVLPMVVAGGYLVAQPTVVSQPTADSEPATDPSSADSPEPAEVAEPSVSLPPREGSQLSEDENLCAICHTDPELWEEEQKHLFVAKDRLAVDVHWKKGVNCSDCHGGDPSSFRPGDAHAEEAGFRDLAEIRQLCAHCHQGQSSAFGQGAHAKAVVKTAEDLEEPMGCGGCHGQDQHSLRPSDDARSPVFAANKMQTCGNCHTQQFDALYSDGEVHSKLGEKDAEGLRTPMQCGACHTEGSHGMLPVDHNDSSVFMKHQVDTCGGCHEQVEDLNKYEDLKKYTDEYKVSVHGNGLYASGLMVTAVCSSCHGAHGIYHPAADDRSTLHVSNVAHTCGKCHHGIEERLAKSVHGRGNGPGELSDRVAPGGDKKLKPSCTVCHEGHDLPDPKSREFRIDSPTRCGSCHKNLSKQYKMTTHGQLTQLGYGPAAKCSDCHGAHDILPIDNPESQLAAGPNRVATCQHCHPGASKKFTDFLPHADPADADRYPLQHFVDRAMKTLLFSVFGFFGLHTVLWFFRSLFDTLRHGRPQRLVPGRIAYVRFEPTHRSLHVVVIVSFLGLALTGLPLMYSNQPWAQAVARALGGFDSTKVWHHVCAVLTVFYFVAHLVWVAKKIAELRGRSVAWKTILFGPDSPVPNARDFLDLGRMFRWFFGLGPRPHFERWTYWEKFDYWAVFWGVAIIGSSGLVRWFPGFFTLFFPGEVLNLAKIIHSEEALLATGFIFAIHFFNTHLRPEKFPMDMVVLAGLVSEEELEDERPEFFERMRREGKLDAMRGTVPARRTLRFIQLGGTVALTVGLGLLAGILLAALGGS
ncbi:MAG TPA: hypothetical protein VMY42_18610 [Thermoguttaceae bacterium]|nr:hypothetical protein [Thermoguttaceae bacterium]